MLHGIRKQNLLNLNFIVSTDKTAPCHPPAVSSAMFPTVENVGTLMTLPSAHSRLSSSAELTSPSSSSSSSSSYSSSSSSTSPAPSELRIDAVYGSVGKSGREPSYFVVEDSTEVPGQLRRMEPPPESSTVFSGDKDDPVILVWFWLSNAIQDFSWWNSQLCFGPMTSISVNFLNRRLIIIWRYLRIKGRIFSAKQFIGAI